jgi:hypothetical protein
VSHGVGWSWVHSMESTPGDFIVLEITDMFQISLTSRLLKQVTQARAMSLGR